MIKKLKQIFPYAITISLWYLSGPRYNPFGILALIPIFYYMFSAREKNWFGFGFLMCFLIDFSAGTLFLFSSVFLLSKALNDFYGFLENEGNGFNVRKFNMFLMMLSLSMFVYAIFNARFFWNFLAGIVWLYIWLLILYLPFVALFRRVKNDR
jgi:hypothetical protein